MVGLRDLKQYNVLLVDFGQDYMGSEQGGVRPAVVIQNDMGNLHSDTTIVMPFTTKLKKTNMPTHTLISKGKDKGLNETSMVLGECIRQVSQQRIKKILGNITDKDEQAAIRQVYNANFGE